MITAPTPPPAWLTTLFYRRRYEPHLLFGSVLLLDPKQPPPLQQQRSRNAVSPRCRRNLAWRLQTLQHDLELLILGPASPPTRLHHFKPPDLSTVRMTVHKDSSQHRASSDKAVSAGGIRRFLGYGAGTLNASAARTH